MLSGLTFFFFFSLSWQVHFLHQEELLQCLRQAVEQKLAGANQSRTFYSQVP